MRSKFFIYLLVWMILLYPLPVFSQDNERRLNQLEAAAHYYVVSYTIFPNVGKEIQICLAEKNKLTAYLENVFESHKKDGLTFNIAFLKDVIQPATNCNILILSDNKEFNKEIIEKLSDFPILTVSSLSNITEYGGMVYIEKGKAPMIKLPKVTNVGIKIDSSLLSIAQIVQ